MNLSRSCCLLLSLAVAHRHAVDGFTLRMSMSADLPPPLRLTAASPPPKSALTATAAPMVERVRPLLREPTPRAKPMTLGLLTFDLDDSLYPIEPVLADANNAFVNIMKQYGYSIDPEDIVNAGKRIREEAGPAGTAMSHTDVRMAAIREEMEK